MRIAFAGASGTGKSTLAKYVAEQYGVPMNPIGSRSVAAEMGFASPYDVDKAGKRAEFQRRLIAAKVEWEAGREHFVTDRTTFDNITYTALHDVHAIDGALFEQACVGMRRYQSIVCCPIALFINTDNDPARIAERTYHLLFEALLFGLIDRNVRLWRCDLECSTISARQIEVDRFVRGAQQSDEYKRRVEGG